METPNPDHSLRHPEFPSICHHQQSPCPLRKSLSPTKQMALHFLTPGSFKSCVHHVTSGLAGTYLEMLLKGSKANLWVRNAQLLSFSPVPALFPVFFSDHWNSQSFFRDSLENFGGLTSRRFDYCHRHQVPEQHSQALQRVLRFSCHSSLFGFKLASTLPFLVGNTAVSTACREGNNHTSHIPSTPPTALNGTSSDSPKVATSTLGGKSGGGHLDPGHFGQLKAQIGIWTYLTGALAILSPFLGLTCSLRSGFCSSILIATNLLRVFKNGTPPHIQHPTFLPPFRPWGANGLMAFLIAMSTTTLPLR